MIYLLRHGDAAGDDGRGDAARPLTDKGRLQATRAGEAMARLGYGIDVCLTSPRVRALDTARLACAPLGLEPEIAVSIGDGSYDTLDLVAGRGNVLLVGHEPVLSTEVNRLTGANAKLKKGGLAVLESSQMRKLLGPAELAAIAAAPDS